jgi:hypothetical protein
LGVGGKGPRDAHGAGQFDVGCAQWRAQCVGDYRRSSPAALRVGVGDAHRALGEGHEALAARGEGDQVSRVDGDGALGETCLAVAVHVKGRRELGDAVVVEGER